MAEWIDGVNEGFLVIGFTLAGMAFFGLILLPVVLHSTSKSAAVFLIILSILPAVFSFVYYLNYSTVQGGAHSIGPTLWATLPVLTSVILRVITNTQSSLTTSTGWKILVLFLIVVPVMLVGFLTAFELFMWSGW